MKNLELLNLSDNNISDLGVKYLAEGEWPRLSLLEMSSSFDEGNHLKNNITNSGLKHLLSANWPRLGVMMIDEANE